MHGGGRARELEGPSERVFNGFVDAFEAVIGAAEELYIGLGHREMLAARGQVMTIVEDVQATYIRG